jgi:hypothetical protein
MKYNRREFIERIVLASAVIGIQPWKWACLLFSNPDDMDKRIDALRAWDEIGEAHAAVVPSTRLQINPTVIGNTTLADITSRGVNFGDATWSIVEDNTTWRQQAPMVRIKTLTPGTVSSAYRLDWNINRVGTSIRQHDVPCKILSLSSGGTTGINVLLSETSAFTNYYAYNTSISSPTRLTSGRYISAMRDTPSSIVGVPNIANTFLRVRIQITITAGHSVDVLLGPLSINAYERPIVSFSFDDTNLNEYTFAYLYMIPRGVKGSSCVNSTFGTLPYTRMQEMAQSGMWSIHNHTATHRHLIALDDEDVQDEVVRCRDYLRGLDTHSVFVLPFGETSQDVNNIVYKYYRYIALAGGNSFGIRTYNGYADDPFIERVSLDSATPLATSLTRLDSAIRQGNTLHFYGHNPTPNPLQGGHTDSDDLQRIVDVVARYNNAGIIECATLDEGVTKLNTINRVRP